MSFLELAKERWSVRKFDATPIEDEKVAAILEAAKHAPTAKNNQPQKIYVMKSDEAMAKMRELTPCTYGAPMCFVVAYDDTRHFVAPVDMGYQFGTVDATIVCTHMMLEAYEQGLSSVMVGLFDPAKVVEAFGLPANIHPVLILPVGYAAEDAEPNPAQHPVFRDEDDYVTVL